MKDFLGRELFINDEVVYLARSGASAGYQKYVVTDFSAERVYLNNGGSPVSPAKLIRYKSASTIEEMANELGYDVDQNDSTAFRVSTECGDLDYLEEITVELSSPEPTVTFSMNKQIEFECEPAVIHMLHEALEERGL